MNETLAMLESLAARGEKVHGMSAHEAAARLREALERCARIERENPRHPGAAKERYSMSTTHQPKD